MKDNFMVGCDVYKTNDQSHYKSTHGTIEKIENGVATIIYTSESTWVNRYQAPLQSLTMSQYCYQCEVCSRENKKSV